MGNISAERILDALRAVIDPDFNRDIVSLGFLHDLEIEGKDVSFRIVLTTPACPVKDRFRQEAERVVREAVPEIGKLTITMDAKVPTGSKGVEQENLLPQVKNIIAVASGKGGVGKSTVAANLAVSLAKSGARVGMLDADIYGPSMGVMLGTNDQPKVDEEKKKMYPVKAHGLDVMSVSFLLPPDTPVIWRGPMIMKALEQLMGDVMWPELDYMIVDLPPGTGDAQITLAQKVPISGAIIVTTPNEVALIDARKGLAMFEKVEVPILGIVENMSWFVCPHCGGVSEIFSRGGGEQTAKDAGVEFLGAIPLDPSVRSAGDGGAPVVVAVPNSEVAKAFETLAGAVARSMSVTAMGEMKED